MRKRERFVSIVLILTITIYCLLGAFINNITFAVERSRSENLEALDNSRYPGYMELINELKTAHPNWTFTILYTGLDWNNVIYNETSALHGRSLVQNSSMEWICPTCGARAYDNGSWYCASPLTVSYYMDVRNWLTESYIFAFETLSYDSTTQTIDGVQRILSGTFMDKETITYYDLEGNEQTIEKSYAQIIMEAAEENKVSPYHLASRVKQEQGYGKNSLISGTYTYTDSNGETVTDLRGYYNYFNIGASGGNTTAIIRNGLTKAKSKGWTTPELSIKGGAKFLAGEYISDYQDSLYLEKYQVDSAGGLYNHQYMQNVSAPYSEGYSTYVAYRDLGMLNYSFNFIIPVYENMPDALSPMPNGVEMNPVTENVKITTSYSALKLRSSASSSGTLVGSLNKGTIALRIEKALAMSSDGRYWDKILYDNGTNIIVGYAARIDTDGSIYLTQVEDVITTDEKWMTTEAINLRNGPGLNGTVIKQIIKEKTELIVIDKMTYEISGHTWYRVKLEDGTQGYVSQKYLTNEIIPDEDNPNETEEHTNYKTNGDFIIVAPGTSVDMIEGAINNSDNFATGSSIKLEEKDYILVMLGDVNGDGKVKATDYILIKNYIMDGTGLNEYQLKAADVNKDGKVKSTDYVLIKNYIMDGSPISI